MDILRWMKNSTPEECKLVGEAILERGTKPRTAEWHANIDAAIALQPKPPGSTIAEAIEQGSARVFALHDGLVADGMNHERLIADELQRRGDKRGLAEYIEEVAGGNAVSDVIYSKD